MTADELALLAGVLLSLLFSYAPRLKDRFGALEPIKKRLVMLACLAVVSIGAFGLSCGQVVQSVICDKSGAIELGKTFVLAVIANQATYQISPISNQAAHA